jgi:hypothetical protein
MSRPVVVNEVRFDKSNVKETRVLTKVRNISLFHLIHSCRTSTNHQLLYSHVSIPFVYSCDALRQLERTLTIVGYVVAFVFACFGIILATDAYLCQKQGKADGVMRAADIKLTSSGEVDLTLRVSTNAWFQSRFHEITLDAMNCAIYIDTPRGRRLMLSDASMAQAQSIVLKPKPWWSALDRSNFRGYDAPAYSVEGTVALARVNFASLGDLLIEALVEPWSGTHKLGADCVIDAKVALFSVPSWAVPVTQYKVGADREFNLTHPVAPNSTSSDKNDPRTNCNGVPWTR